MALIVNTNVASLNAQVNLASSTSALATSLQRLSSGLRVNSAKDDAAGLAIAQGLTSQIRGNETAIRNANDGISMGQIAESALGQVQNNLQRIREITIQASNGSISSANRKQLQNEVDQLSQEVGRTLATTEFNGQQIFGPTFSASGIAFQVGYGNVFANCGTSSGASISASQIRTPTGIDLFADPTNNSATGEAVLSGTVTGGLFVRTTDSSGAGGYSAAFTGSSTIDLSTLSGSSNLTALSGMLAKLDDDIARISNIRSVFGALQNRFESVVSNLAVTNENLDAARSRIVDADFAAETAKLTRNQILQQAGTAILSQANSLPQAALTLLR